MPPKDKLDTITIDFDKTIAHNGPHPDYEILGPIDGAKEAIDRLVRAHYKIIICSSRDKLDFWQVYNWLIKYDIKFDCLDLGNKHLCEYYIDDKAIKFDGDWNKTLAEVWDY